ncbi:uncharacterized protein L199_004362 [Kwoniella botswanensis]|uniref:uncharacterized protein n=1 Tax=Kwoniella botswanensis TaxID=1268659 RepID=UPI00315DA439
MLIAAGVRYDIKAHKAHERKKKEKEQQEQIQQLQAQQQQEEQDIKNMLKKDKDTLRVQDLARLDPNGRVSPRSRDHDHSEQSKRHGVIPNHDDVTSSRSEYQGGCGHSHHTACSDVRPFERREHPKSDSDYSVSSGYGDEEVSRSTTLYPFASLRASIRADEVTLGLEWTWKPGLISPVTKEGK